MKKTVLFFLLLAMIASYTPAKAQNLNLTWTKNMGGTVSDEGRSVAVDAAGNIYTTGYFQGIVDFDPNAGVANLTSVGTADIFISKLDASGNFIWAKSMGGTAFDEGVPLL